MRNTINLFKIDNIREIDFSYKLIEINREDLPPENNQVHFNTIVNQVAIKISSKARCPHTIVNDGHSIFVAIPSDVHYESQKIKCLQLSIQTTLLEDVKHATWEEGLKEPNIRNIITDLLEFQLRAELKNYKYALWEYGSGKFYPKKETIRNERENVDIYRGFSFKLVNMGAEIYICLDIQHKYMSSKFLSDMIAYPIDKKKLDKTYNLQNAIYLNGSNWYAIQIKGFGDVISKVHFLLNNESHNLYEYIKNNLKNDKLLERVHPEVISLKYSYANKSMVGDYHSAATSLTKILYHTSSPNIKRLHSHTVLSPEDRFNTIINFIKIYFSKLEFNNQKLKIGASPYTENTPIFNIPSLKFGNNNVYEVKNRQDLMNFKSKRTQLIRQNGILNTTDPFAPQYLLFPSSIAKNDIKVVLEELQSRIQKLAPKFVFKAIPYDIDPYLSSFDQVNELGHLFRREKIDSGVVLFLLSDELKDKKVKNLHDCLKRTFFPYILFQCAQQTKLFSFFKDKDSKTGSIKLSEETSRKFQSYGFNLMNSILIAHKRWMFALSKPLNYNVYVAIDIHDRFVGFSFLYKNGEDIVLEHTKIAKKDNNSRREKLSKANLKPIYTHLKNNIDLYLHGIKPNGIIFIRDGKCFPQEEEALREYFNNLVSENIISNDCIYGLISLYKQNSIPLRIVKNELNTKLNPQMGTYKQISDTELFLFNTGFPFEFKGTSSPIQLIKYSGNFDFIKVAQDIFAQSILSFASPDNSSSLPITIKLIDLMLEPVAIDNELTWEQDGE